MEKIDLRKQYRHLYNPPANKISIVEVPEFQFVMLDGAIEKGEQPDTSRSFREAFEALYGVSFTLKFNSKRRGENPIDYPVMAVEGLWWVEEGEFDINVKDNWSWTLMMLQPEHITREMYDQAVDQVGVKRPNPALARLRFERFREGLSMQVMHVGPYSAEAATIEKMQAFARENGYALRGKHHEIYLGDPRRAQPEKLKTVLRQPVERV
jgi:hypothetical protein